jgi:hypothetical protein
MLLACCENPKMQRASASFSEAKALLHAARFLPNWQSDNQEGKSPRQIARRDRGAANEVVVFLTSAAGAIKTILSQDELELVRRPR